MRKICRGNEEDMRRARGGDKEETRGNEHMRRRLGGEEEKLRFGKGEIHFS